MKPRMNAERRRKNNTGKAEETTRNDELGTRSREAKPMENKTRKENRTTKGELNDRTKAFALRLIKLVDALPNIAEGKVIRN